MTDWKGAPVNEIVTHSRRGHSGHVGKRTALDEWVKKNDDSVKEPDIEVLLRIQAKRDGLKNYDPLRREEQLIEEKATEDSQKQQAAVRKLQEFCGLREFTPGTSIAASDTFAVVQNKPALAVALQAQAVAHADPTIKRIGTPMDGSMPARSKSNSMKALEAASSSSGSVETGPVPEHNPIDLSQFSSAKDLEGAGAETLKNELMRLGLKCGGPIDQRAERLWLTKGVEDLSSLPQKLFVAKRPHEEIPAPGNFDPHLNIDKDLLNPKLRKIAQGPLPRGVERKPGQKSLPGTASAKQKMKAPREARADSWGPLL